MFFSYTRILLSFQRIVIRALSVIPADCHSYSFCNSCAGRNRVLCHRERSVAIHSIHWIAAVVLLPRNDKGKVQLLFLRVVIRVLSVIPAQAGIGTINPFAFQWQFARQYVRLNHASLDFLFL